MAHLYPVAFIDKIQMRVDLQDVDRTLVGKGLDTGDVDGMVAANDHRQGPRAQDRLNACADIGMALRCVGMHDVGIADVNDAHRLRQVGRVIFVVIGPRMAKAEQG